MSILSELKRQIIISVQAMEDEPFYEEAAINAMMKSVVNGGAKGLRLSGARDIKNAKKMFDLPIIGLTKPKKLPSNWKEIVYITPSIADVKEILDADIIAIDATLRPHPKETTEEILNFIKQNNKIAMADISNLEEGIKARELGFDIISTTLSGYTQNSDNTQLEPDFELLEHLVKMLDCPIFLEGRIENRVQVKKAFELGAHAVVIGSSVTRPQIITQRFVNYE